MKKDLLEQVPAKYNGLSSSLPASTYYEMIPPSSHYSSLWWQLCSQNRQREMERERETEEVCTRERDRGSMHETERERERKYAREREREREEVCTRERETTYYGSL